MLRLAYFANIAILTPVVAAALLSDSAHRTVFQGRFVESPELSALVGCLWAAILICSIIGLGYPREMIAILIFQVIYKALFLALVLLPMAQAGGWASLPHGLTIAFAAIVAIWPFIIWGNLRAS